MWVVLRVLEQIKAKKKIRKNLENLKTGWNFDPMPSVSFSHKFSSSSNFCGSQQNCGDGSVGTVAL